MRILKLILTVILFTSCNPSDHKSSPKQAVLYNSPWIFDKVVGSALKFKNGRTFETHLYNLSYIDLVTGNNGGPFFIYMGRDCDECDAETSLYVQTPSAPEVVEAGENRYGCPGTERDFATDSLMSTSRAFYGQVLPNITGVIWFQNELMQDKTWQKSTFLVNLNSGKKKETRLKGNSQLNITLDQLRKGLCKEIKGINMKTEP